MFHKQLIIIFLIASLIVLLLQPYTERFDATGMEFLPVGEQRYGLRGDKIMSRDIAGNYISPKRQIRLSQSSGMMYESNTDPITEGMKGCRKLACPSGPRDTTGYDHLDTCWQCGSDCPTKLRVPDIWPHVKN